MSSFLCFTIHFLQPYSHGRAEDVEPEWPPSPLRGFQALVAAAAARWNERLRVEHAASALRWLEELPAPTILAPSGVPSDCPYLLYIPNNTADLLVPAWKHGDIRKAVKREQKPVRPVHLRGGDAVHYLYALPDGGCPHLDVLSAAARSITHLGWGVDMVAGSAAVITDEQASKLQGERWQPTEGSTTCGLRVPKEGTLADLAVKHTAFLNRLGEDGFSPVSPLSAFRVVGYRRVTDLPAARWAAFRLRRPTEDRPAFIAENSANHVAAMTRSATGWVAAQQGQPGDWIDRYVHGHRKKGEDSLPRFSYLPLPSLERRGDRGIHVGAIRRVLVAELLDSGESHLQWVRQMLPGQFLVDDKTKERRAMLDSLVGADWVLRQYTDPSDTWVTVTPVVLPGSDDGKRTKAEKLFFKALCHAGYSPDSLVAAPEFRNVSFWPGGDLALRFQRPDYLKNGHWSVYHVRLRWKQEIKGPLAIGAGRHCGLGIFALTTGGPSRTIQAVPR